MSDASRQRDLSAAVTPSHVLAPADPDANTHAGAAEPTGQFADAPLASPAAAALPAIPGYEILGELGRGGMGVVYKARQLNPRRLVALKLMTGGAHPELLRRFQEEANAAARLSHPNIVQIHEVGVYEGRPFLCLEFVDGPSLGAKVQGMPQPPREAAALIETVARAMHHVHQRGVVHRDLKPGNILLAARGLAADGKPQAMEMVPKVADFGLARLLDADQSHTATGAVLGTPSYMAPEQAWGKSKLHPIGPHTDVYALGATLYVLLTGRPPLLADTPLATVQLVASDDEPVPPARLQPKVPRDLETICLKCLRKKPAERYAGAEALADDLRRFLDGRPVLARPVGRLARAWRWCRRHPARAGLLAVVLVSLGVVSALLGVTLRQLDVAEQRYRERHQAVNNFFTEVSENVLLDEPGMQPLRKKLLERALRSYEHFLAERGEDGALRAEVARTYFRVGQITGDVGARDASLAAYRKAVALQEQLHAEDPTNPELAGELVLTCEWLGVALHHDRRPDEALALLRKARDLLEAPGGAGPHRERLLSDVLNDLTLLYLRLGEPGQGLEAIEKATQLRERFAGLASAAPLDRSRLAASHHNRGLVLQKLGRTEEALAAYRKARDLHAKLVRDQPRVTSYRNHLATHLSSIGALLADGPRPADGLAPLKEAHALRAKLAEENPEVQGFQYGLALSHRNLGRLQFKTFKVKDALESFMRAAGLLAKSGAEGDDRFQRQKSAAGVHGHLGSLQLLTGQRDAAERSFRKSAEILAGLVREGSVFPEDDWALGEAYYFVGTGMFLLKQADEARAAFERVLAHWPQVLEKAPAKAGLRMDLNRSYFTLAKLLRDAGRPAEAARMALERRKLWPRDANQVYDAACELALCAAAAGKGGAEHGDRAMSLLREALALGLKNPQGMATDPDLAALRPRPDFERLVREATAAAPKGP